MSSDLTGTAVAALDAVGLEGVANTASTLTDNDGSAREYLTEVISIPNDSDTHVIRVFIKKDADISRFPEIGFSLVTGTAQRLLLGLNTNTGATANRASTGTTASEVNDFGDWWEVLLSVQNNTTGNVSVLLEIAPAIATVIGGINNAATAVPVSAHAAFVKSLENGISLVAAGPPYSHHLPFA